MIIIKSDLNHLDETKLDFNEAQEFIKCLQQEYYRHIHGMNGARLEMRFAEIDMNYTRKMFFTKQYENHRKDIQMIIKCITYLEDKFRLKKVEL